MPKIYQSPARYKATELRTYYAPYFVTRSLTPAIRTAVPTFTRSGTAMWLDNTGTFQSAATNTPRFEYEYNATTGLYESIGLLIEGQACSNLRTYSNDFSQSGVYTLSAVTQASSSQGPLGTAFLVAATATTAAHGLSHSITTTSTNSITYSVMAKASGLTTFTLFAEANATWMTFDLTGNGSVAGSANTTYSKIRNLGNGWFHCFMSFTSGTTGSQPFRLFLGNGGSFLGNGTDGVLIAGMQVAVNSSGATPYFVALSYVPTTSSTATRNTESCVFSDTTWQTSSGTYEALFRGGYENGSGEYGRVLSCGSATRSPLSSRAGDGMSAFDGTNSFSVTGASNKNQFGKGCTKYDSVSLKMYGAGNGVLASTNPTYTTGTFVGGCAVGHNISGGTSNPLNGHIKMWSFIPSYISDNDMLQRSRL